MGAEDSLPLTRKRAIIFGDYCWLWVGRLEGGYGRTKVVGVHWPAHRVIYTLLVGPIPEGLVLDHLCRVRHCVRPAHLEPITEAENIRRGRAGRNHASKTHCPQGHAYSTANTQHVQSERHCRTCKRERARQRRSRG